ncbi:AAA family ATPase [Agrococcus sp. TSP3-2-1]|uniref:AAA family ATPase n=1 Tax=Agrococcus sp. TSP3-2-1 TaxID=2804583 RepID=UPI003CF64EA3
MARMTLLCGPVCAGKTTIARELEAAGALVLSYDREAWARGVRDGRPARELVEQIDADFLRLLEQAVLDERDVVLDASLSTRAMRDRWRMRCGAMGLDPDLVVVRAPLETLLERLREREPGPESVVLDPDELRAYVAGFEWPGPGERHRVVETA